jgi:hypothetical protein
MKTTIIPAQITTVEDKIAGNLSLTQIIILMLPVFWAGIVYILLVPRMAFAWYKVIMIIPVLLISFILSLRIEDKLVINWLILLLRYNARPKYYVFNKNDTFLRTVDLPVLPKKAAKSVNGARVKTASNPYCGIKEQIAFEKDKENITFRVNGKGGFNVVLDKIEK